MHSLFFFIVALALLIVVHEYGHFWVARRCGVKVLKFSVGFGKPLWSKLGKDGTEYVIGAIPLGGYVKMLDEREGNVPADQLHQAFNRQPLRARVAIVSAGPIANLVFAVLAYWLIFVIGIPGIRPIVDEIAPNTAAEHAQIIAGDEIKAIDGRATPTWNSVYKLLWKQAEHGGLIEFTVDTAGVENKRSVSVPKLELQSAGTILTRLGIQPIRPKITPTLGKIKPNSAAEQAGLQQGDLLLTADAVHIEDWQGWVELIRSRPEQTIIITVKRQGKIIELTITPVKTAENVGQIGAGVDISYTEIPSEIRAELRYGVVQALVEACRETWQFSALTVKSLFGMFAGTVSTKNLGGPISIAQIAGASAESGFISFVGFLAMISISLGILNLLPIPVLDGGHLAMYCIEWLKGSPVSEQAQIQGQKVGVLLLLLLMVLAFFNDLTRLFG
ncbi:MAG: RIP metalloprotease RseP [Gammaproteobacteria bacterium]|nr:MAG: RIP metalloprotease RseP [Gammaproteobacteria bacterium]